MTTDMPSDIVGRRIKASRLLRDWTMKDLAKRCAAIGSPQMTMAVIANIECGRRASEGRRRRRVTVDELVILAFALGVDPAVLMGGLLESAQGMIEADEVLSGYALDMATSTGRSPAR